MGYDPRYKFSFNNELNELVEIFFDLKNGAGGSYSANDFITIIDDNTLILNSGVIVDAVEIGELITFGGHSYTISSFSYDTGNYTINIVEGGLTGISSGAKDYVIGPLDMPTDLQELENVISCDINCNSDSSDLFDTIITRELILRVHLPAGSPIEFDTFLATAHDDWKVRATIDAVPVFHGYLIPDEGPTPFQDKPYEIELHASDGLKLLSKTTLVSYDGTEFDSYHSYVELIAACLQQCGLELPIRVYCNIYYNPMVTRADNIMYDAFQQMYLDYRTFMTSATQFVDCYTALQIMLKDHFRLYYDEGRWTIYRIAEYQYLPEGNRYYTDYEWTGSIMGGAIDTADFAKVGKDNIVRPINENQTLTAQFANKTVRHNFKYNIWPEIPRNNKFERVTEVVGMGDATTKYFTINDWDYIKGDMDFPGVQTVVGPGTGTCYEKRTYNVYGVELTREIVFTPSTSPAEFETDVLVSKDIPVSAGDVIDVNFDMRSDLEVSDGTFCVSVYIIPSDGSTIIQLFRGADREKGVWTIGTRAGLWPGQQGDTTGFPTNEYTNLSITSDAIPKDGTMHVAFWGNTNHGRNGAAVWYFRNFTLDYHPYISGGFISVTGNYWTRSQAKTFPDTYDTEIMVSDSLVGSGKGTLLFFGGVKTVSDWWRYGLGGSEIRSYVELVNLGYYNFTYRRFWKIDGDFDGTKYVNNIDMAQHPVSFTPKYRFEDLTTVKDFVLVCPLKMDLVKGRFNVTFREVWASAADGTQQGDSSDFKYLFE